MKNTIRLFFTLIVLFMLSADAFSQTQSTPTPAADKLGGGFFDNLTGAATYLKHQAGNSITESLFNAGVAFSKQTTSWALAVAGSLAILYLITESIGLLASRGSAIQMLFDVGLPVVLAAYLLLNYGDLILTFAGKGGFLDYIRTFAGDSTLTIMDMYAAILKLITTSITQSWIDFRDSLKIGPNIIMNVIAAAMNILGTILFSLVIIVLCFTGLAEIIGLVMMGPFLTAVAVAFGPIFICGIVTPWTRDYFSRWIGFLVASAVLTSVVSVCISIATTLFTTFAFAEVAGDTMPSASGLLIAAIMIMSINSLIQQAPAIANALVPGSIGASKSAGSAISKGAEAVSGKAKAIGKSAKGVRDASKAKLDKSKSKTDGGGSGNGSGGGSSTGGTTGGNNASTRHPSATP